MKAPEVRPTVQLTGNDNNSFYILGKVTKALKRAGADQEYVDQCKKEAIAGDYNNLLAVTMQYVEVE